MRNRTLAIIFLVTAIASYGGTAHAQFTFLGPTPYLSAADSPIDMSGLGTTFFLEDFEDFEANTLGLVPINFGGAGGSVDSDDGIIDGSGVLGLAVTPVPLVCTSFQCLFELSFEFEASALGFLPTAFGIVLLSGGGSTTELSVVDALSNEQIYDLSGINLNRLETSDDRFIGVTNHNGIVRFTISKFDLRQTTNPTLIDHIQYGLMVPEPTGVLALILCLPALTQARSLRLF